MARIEFASLTAKHLRKRELQPRFGSVIDNRVSIGFHMITGRLWKPIGSGWMRSSWNHVERPYSIHTPCNRLYVSSQDSFIAGLMYTVESAFWIAQKCIFRHNAQHLKFWMMLDFAHWCAKLSLYADFKSQVFLSWKKPYLAEPLDPFRWHQIPAAQKWFISRDMDILAGVWSSIIH